MIRILVPLDGSALAEEALLHARAIAKVFPAEVTLLRAIFESRAGTAVQMDSVDFALWRHQAQAYLRDLQEEHATEDMPIRCEVLEGIPAETIISHIKQAKPDLLVLTRYGRGNARDFATGGTAQKIVSGVDCSVLLLDPRTPVQHELTYHRILVPVDDSKESDCAVAVATMIAEIHGASLLLLHVVEEPHLPDSLPASRHGRELVSEMHRLVRHEATRRLHELAERITKSVTVKTQILLTSDAALAIESTSEDNDSDLLLLHLPKTAPTAARRYGLVNQLLIQYSHKALFVLQPSAGEGFASNFRSVYLDDQCLEAS
jgi:nucleotide-binding universal stress UspA family protein